jgi:hypothetical protein
MKRGHFVPSPVPRGQTQMPLTASMIRQCRVCGCTDDDCTECIRRTGRPCVWVAGNLCSACQPVKELEAA